MRKKRTVFVAINGNEVHVGTVKSGLGRVIGVSVAKMDLAKLKGRDWVKDKDGKVWTFREVPLLRRKGGKGDE